MVKIKEINNNKKEIYDKIMEKYKELLKWKRGEKLVIKWNIQKLL